VQGESQTSDEVRDEDDPLPRLGSGDALARLRGPADGVGGVYPTVLSSSMVASVTLEATHFPFRSASAIVAGSGGLERVFGLEMGD
jgi:hypothetical protein